MRDIDRMLARLEEKGQTEADLAKWLGVRHQVIYNWKSRGKIPGDRLSSVARFLMVNTDWLQHGTGEKERQGEGEASNVEPGPQVKGEVPVISWVQAGHPCEAVDLYYPGQADEWVQTTAPVKRHTFALWVENDSMMPTFPPGIRIIVEPEIDAEVGDYVVARDKDGHTTFKRLVQDGGDYFLKPLNPDYQMKQLDGWEVVGVVREAVWKFR